MTTSMPVIDCPPSRIAWDLAAQHDVGRAPPRWTHPIRDRRQPPRETHAGFRVHPVESGAGARIIVATDRCSNDSESTDSTARRTTDDESGNSRGVRGAGGDLPERRDGGRGGADGEPQAREARPEVGGAAGLRAGRHPVRRRHQGGRALRHRHRRPGPGGPEAAGAGQGRRRQGRGDAGHRPPAGADQRPGRQPAVGQRLSLGVPRTRTRRDPGHRPDQRRRQARGAGARQRPVRQGRGPQRPGPRRQADAARTCGTSRSPTWPMSTAASSWPACRTRSSPRG